jgi:O-antigen ligase
MEGSVKKGEFPTAGVERKALLVVLLFTTLLLACLKFRVLLIAVLAILGAVLVAGLVISPASAGYMLTFLAYGHVSSAFLPGVFSALLAVSFTAWIVRALLGSDVSFSATRVDLALLLYVCTMLLSMLFSTTPETGGPFLLLTAKWLVFYALLVNIVSTEKAALWVTGGMLMGALLSGLVGLWVFSQERMLVVLGAVFRAAGLAGDPNELALVMVTAMPVSACMIGIVRGKPLKALFIATTLALVAANLVTLSRTGLVVMVVVLLLIAFHEKGRPWVKVAVVLFIVVLPFVVPAQFLRRITLALLVGDYSAYLRSSAMAAGLRMFAENPITGVGLGAYLGKSIQYGDLLFPLVAHNMYLHVLAETGILGFSALLFVIGSSFHNMRLAERAAAEGSPLWSLIRGYRIAYVAFLLSGFLLTIQFNQSFWYMSAASVFLLRAARRNVSESVA